MARTYYDVLGVTRDADAERVRAAYRERVKEVHPDVSDRPDAAEQFRRLSAARDVLCDPDERARYDRLGHEAYTGDSPGSHGASTPPTGENDGHGSNATDVGDSDDRDEADDGTGAANDRTTNAEWRRQRRRRRRRADAWASGRGTGTRGERQRRNTRETTAASGGDRGTSTRAGAGNVAGGQAGPDGDSWYRTGAGDTTGYRVSTRTDSAAQFTVERGLLAAAVFICYPMLLGVAVLPVFGTVVRVAAAVCALLVVAQTLSIPESGVLVFGALTLTAPIGLRLAGVAFLSPEAVLAWAFCWIPFVIAVGNFLALRG